MDYKLTEFIREELVRSLEVLLSSSDVYEYSAYNSESAISSMMSRLLAGNFEPYEPEDGDIFNINLINRCVSTFSTDINKLYRMEELANDISTELYNASQVKLANAQSMFSLLSQKISGINATRSIHSFHIVEEFNNSSMIDDIRSSGYSMKNGVLTVDMEREEYIPIASVTAYGNGEPGNNFQSFINEDGLNRVGEDSYNGDIASTYDNDSLTLFEYESCALPKMVNYRIELQSAVGIFNYTNKILDPDGSFSEPIEKFTGGHGLNYSNGQPWYKRPATTIFDSDGNVSNFDYANWFTKQDYQLWQGAAPLGAILTFDIGGQTVDTVLVSTPILPYKGFTPPYISSVRGIEDGNIVDLTHNATFLHLNETADAPGASALISFSPRELTQIIITIMQPNYYPCLLAHKYAQFVAEFSISDEKLADQVYRYERRVPTALHKYNNLDQLERLVVSDLTLPNIVNLPNWVIPRKTWVDVGYEPIQGKRWCIPIRDIRFYHKTYKNTMSLTSVPFSVNGAKNVRLIVDYDTHGVSADDMKIQFAISFDDKTWYNITPMNAEGESPQVYYINAAPDEENAEMIQISPHPATVRLRTSVVNHGDINYSPTFYSYELLLDSEPHRSIPLVNVSYHDLVSYIVELDDPFGSSLLNIELPGSFYYNEDIDVDTIW